MPENPSIRTVLVVEDSDPLRKMIGSMLRDSHFHVLEAANGAEALEILARDGGSINLVLTDVVMPHISGTELARSLSLIRPELPVLFMSGFSDDPVVHGLENGSAFFLRKPFTAATLLDSVRNVLARTEAINTKAR
jgi:two-component system, cell cycle sensor histidine kinase and response regulator CckA